MIVSDNHTSGTVSEIYIFKYRMTSKLYFLFVLQDRVRSERQDFSHRGWISQLHFGDFCQHVLKTGSSKGKLVSSLGHH
jgi:hypothetical protein